MAYAGEEEAGAGVLGQALAQRGGRVLLVFGVLPHRQ